MLALAVCEGSAEPLPVPLTRGLPLLLALLLALGCATVPLSSAVCETVLLRVPTADRVAPP